MGLRVQRGRSDRWAILNANERDGAIGQCAVVVNAGQHKTRATWRV
jgi:hypothetical protein